MQCRDTQFYPSSPDLLNFATEVSNTPDCPTDSESSTLSSATPTAKDCFIKIIQKQVSGETCKPSEDNPVSSLWSQVVAHARTTQVLTPKAKGLQGHVLSFGGNNSESFKNVDQRSPCGKTPQDADIPKEKTNFLPLEPFSGRLSRAGIVASGSQYKLVNSVRPMNVNAALLLPTPLTCSSDSELYRRPGQDKLERRLKLLPTPTARDARHGKTSKNSSYKCVDRELSPIIPEGYVSHPHVREWMLGLKLDSTRITKAAGGVPIPLMVLSQSPSEVCPTEVIASQPSETAALHSKPQSAGNISTTSLHALSLQPTEADKGKEVYVDAVEKRGTFKGGIHQRNILGTVTTFGVVKFPDCQSVSLFPLEEIELVPQEKATASTAAETYTTTGDYTMVSSLSANSFQDVDFDGFPHDNPNAIEAVKRSTALNARKLITEIQSKADAKALLDVFTKPQLSWVRENVLTPEENKAYLQIVQPKRTKKAEQLVESPIMASSTEVKVLPKRTGSISAEVLEVLENATVEGNAIKLNSPQLDRKLYTKVNDVLGRIGGKWKGGKVAAHLFDSDPTEALQIILQTGDLPDKNPLAFFATPDDLALRIAEMLLPENVQGGVLEPSAGKGALALAVTSIYFDAQVDCVEIDSGRASHLKSLGFEVHNGDFLGYEPRRKYGAIVMNPPFSTKEDKLAYVTHIEKAFSLLEDGGQLIAIAPSGLTFNNQKRVQEFRTLVQEYGNWEEIEDGAFKSSGTAVSTVLVSMQKAKAEIANDAVVYPRPDYNNTLSTFAPELLATPEELLAEAVETEESPWRVGAWVCAVSEREWTETKINEGEIEDVSVGRIEEVDGRVLTLSWISSIELEVVKRKSDYLTEIREDLWADCEEELVKVLEQCEEPEVTADPVQSLDENQQATLDTWADKISTAYKETATLLVNSELVGTSDTEELEQIETEIEEIQKSAWQEIGQRLLRIRDGNLYKAKGYKTWDGYCRDRWNYGKSYANDLINAVKAQETLTGSTVILTNPNQAIPIRKMVNAGVQQEAIQELVEEVAESGLSAEKLEQAAQEKGLLPRKEAKKPKDEVAALGQDLGLKGSGSHQLPDIEPNADIPPEKLPPSLLACFTLLDVTDFIQTRQADAIAEFVAITWQDRFRLRQLTEGVIDNQLMGGASEQQVRQIAGLLHKDKDSKIDYLQSLLLKHEKTANDYWDEVVKTRDERDKLAQRVAMLEAELSRTSAAA